MKKELTAQSIWLKRNACVEYNQSIDLYDTVKENENFYVGKQWEGVNAPDLDKPIFNFLKRVVSYFVSMICSDDITINIEPFKDDENGSISLYCQFFKEEIYALFERHKIPSKLRQAVRDCAVDGDAAMYTYFEPNFETHQAIKGAVFVENTENTSILFGNHSSSDVNKQPYIIIEQRRYVDSLKEEAKELYNLTDEQIESIHADNDFQENKDDKGTNQLCTVLFYFFKVKGSVHYVISTKDLILKEDTDLEIPDYPISYFSWDKIKNSYHGQAVLTGMIPNQIYVNKLFAMCMLYTQRMGFPWTVFDRTKIEQVTNKIGQAFGTNPDVANKLMDFYKAPDFSNQILNLIDIVINYTRDFMGANDASLGNVKPDNTSAIIAVQEASSIPLQMQKQAYNQFVEDTIRNMIDMMCATYGTREVRMPVNGQKGKYEYMTIDFTRLKGINYSLSIDIGSSSHYDENSRMQTLGNLWDRQILDDAVVFVDSIPDKLLPNKDEIIKSLKEKQEAMLAQQEAEKNMNDLAMKQENMNQMINQQQVMNQAPVN